MFFDSFLFLLMALYFNKAYGAAIGILLFCCVALIQIGYILLFKKVGLSPWKALIPFYNMYLFYGKLYKTGNHMISLCCVSVPEIIAVCLLFLRSSNLLVFLSAVFFGFLISVFIYYDISKAFGLKEKWWVPTLVLLPWAMLIFCGIAKDIQFGSTIHFADVHEIDVTARAITGLILFFMFAAFFLISKSYGWLDKGVRPVAANKSVTTAVSGTDIETASGTNIGTASGTDIGTASGTDIGTASGTDIGTASGTDIETATNTDIGSSSSSNQNINTATATDIK